MQRMLIGDYQWYVESELTINAVAKCKTDIKRVNTAGLNEELDLYE